MYGERKERSDKGIPRAKYRIRDRKYKQTIRDMMRQKKDIEKFEKWEKHRPLAENRKQKRTAKFIKRRALRTKRMRIALIPKDKICSCCNRKRASLRSWVLVFSVVEQKRVAICRSCYLKNPPEIYRAVDNRKGSRKNGPRVPLPPAATDNTALPIVPEVDSQQQIADDENEYRFS